MMSASPSAKGPRRVSTIYLGISLSTFDKLVESGQMPKPKHIGMRRVWDRMQVDAAFMLLPDGNVRDDDPWGKVAV
jgi:predicted DNA-binding transcriptional regulator AlpA